MLRWIDICPYKTCRSKFLPVPPPVKHMKHVKDMAKDRPSIFTNSGIKQNSVNK